jgi:segregation and condensation protein A
MSADPQATPEFIVELPLFSGPFRLLADLILDQKIDVCDVPVATVTERFLAEGTEAASGWSLDEATWFLAVCAVLLEMKVGRLLPRPQPSTEEELLGGESPDLLYARSIELIAFTLVAARIGELMVGASLMAPRIAGPAPELAHLYPDLLEHVSASDLAGAAAELFRPSPVIDLSHVTPIRASVADAVRAMQERLWVSPQARFRDLVEGCHERIEVVVRFLALLELYRQGKVELSQATLFGEIQVRWQGERRGSESDEAEVRIDD